jgi:hypothetical protein
MARDEPPIFAVLYCVPLVAPEVSELVAARAEHGADDEQRHDDPGASKSPEGDANKGMRARV